jgi:hypothetical protein
VEAADAEIAASSSSATLNTDCSGGGGGGDGSNGGGSGRKGRSGGNVGEGRDRRGKADGSGASNGDASPSMALASEAPPSGPLSSRFRAFVCDPATDNLAAAVQSELQALTPPTARRHDTSDATTPASHLLPPPSFLVDAILMVFVLSAVPPDDIPRFLASVGMQLPLAAS